MKIHKNNIKLCDCFHCVIRNLFFKHLKENEIEILCKLRVQKSLKKRHSILSHEIHNKYLVYLRSGLVMYYTKLSDKKNHIIMLVKPYEPVSLLSIFNNTTLRYNITAVEDSVLCFIPIKNIESIIKKNAEFSYDYIKNVTTTANKILERFLTINIKNLKGRVAFILLELADEIYKNNAFLLPITRKEISEMIGMSTENVIRTLSEFKKEKIIKICGKKIEILDKEKLKKISSCG